MAKDLYNEAVKLALLKEGWTITHDPYQLKTLDSAKYEIDFGAEKIIAAEKETEKIAIEVKSFLSPSVPHEFHKAIGQYLNYLVLLEIAEPNRKLYLAIPEEVYQDFFVKMSTKLILERFHVHLLVFEPIQNQLILWLEN